MNTEVFIENYRLDITAEISSLITFALDDVRDFSARSTSWSKAIVLPGTANNNKLFGHIFQTGQANAYDSAQANVGYNFNASKSAACIIFQDNIQTFKGVLRLLSITLDKGRPEYEVAVFGDITSLNVSLSSGLLEDLDFSAYDHNYDETAVTNSWNNTPGTGYYYPLIDYGTYSTNKHDWDLRTFRPALYVREYIDKMFTAAGFRWSSTLFDTSRFKSLIIPHNQKILTTETTLLFSASRTGGGHVLDSGTAPSVALQFSTVLGTSFTASMSNSRFTYNLADTQTVHFSASASGTYVGQTVGFNIEVKKNGVSVMGTLMNLPITGTATPQFYGYGKTFDLAMSTGDYVELIFTPTAGIFGGDYITATAAGLGGSSLIVSTVAIGYGDLLEINSTIPRNIRQIDFLVSIVKLFNLYVYEDKFDKNLINITPYIDYYSTSSADAVDWTYKLNRDKVITIKPMSELNSKIYEFKFKSDGDFYNDLYSKRYGQNYGDRIYDSEFEFTDQVNSLELIFSSTPLVGYGGEEKVYPTIFKRSGPDSAPVEENTDSNIRIMQTKKMTGVTSWDIMDGVTVLTSTTDYGYAGHLDDPDAPDNDLNFGALQELFFVLTTGDLSKNQFNLYWSSYMAEITDKDSKLITGFFHLTPKDILDLDFSKKVQVDGVLFRLNKISDYNMSKPDTCKVELIKINYLIY